MTTAHTPGPWRIGDAGHTIFGPKNGTPSPATVARLVSANPANARLIAAAPELLAAVEWLIDQVADPIAPASDWGRRHAQARAAIRAAKGE